MSLHWTTGELQQWADDDVEAVQEANPTSLSARHLAPLPHLLTPAPTPSQNPPPTGIQVGGVAQW